VTWPLTCSASAGTGTGVIARAGANTFQPYRLSPPDRTIAAGEIAGHLVSQFPHKKIAG